MNKFLVGVAAVVTIGALVLVGCPDDNGGSVGLSYICKNGTAVAGTGDTVGVSNCDSCSQGYTLAGNAGRIGSTCVANASLSACTATGSTKNLVTTVYSEGTYAACNPLGLAAEPTFGAFVAGGLAHDFTFTEANGGAGGTSRALRLVTTDPDAFSGGGFISLGANFDVSGKALRFSIKPPAVGVVSEVRVILQTGSGGITRSVDTNQTLRTEGIATVINNGIWQEVVIDIDSTYSFRTSVNTIRANTVRSIGFYISSIARSSMDPSILSTTNFGTDPYYIDEVYFEEVRPNCTVPAGSTASVDLIWGDAVYNSCAPVSANTNFYGAHHIPSRNAASRPPSPFTFSSNAATSLGGGASDSSLFTTLATGGGYSAWAYGIAELSAAYDATGKALKFSIKSPAAASGGVDRIDVFLEGEAAQDGGPGARTNTLTQMFTNDGTWQAVSIPITSFTFPASGVTLSTVWRIVFSLADANGLSADGLGAQTLDIDEIRFE